jgi:hypothetical protein
MRQSLKKKIKRSHRLYVWHWHLGILYIDIYWLNNKYDINISLSNRKWK